MRVSNAAIKPLISLFCIRCILHNGHFLQVCPPRLCRSKVRANSEGGVSDPHGEEVQSRVPGGLHGGKGQASLHDHPAPGMQGKAKEKVRQNTQEKMQTSKFNFDLDHCW